MLKINLDVPPPYAIQLEPVEGCSLACSFCAIQSIRENDADAEMGIHGKNSAPYRFASVEMIERVVTQAFELGWNPRWEFAMHGEPTMHPKLVEMVAAVRRVYKNKAYILVTTNGSGLLKNTMDKVSALFYAGVNTLALDDYQHSVKNGPTWVQQIRATLDDDIIGPAWSTFNYPADGVGNPHQRHKGKKLVIIHDISENTDGVHKLTNQGASSFAADDSVVERCAKPFRELSIRWDGAVALCCDDWPGRYKVGSVMSTPLHDLWYSERMEAARRHLYVKDRNFGPCKGCNVKTMRNGLLPDKLGRSDMAAPGPDSREVVKQAMRGKVFTIKLAKGD